MAEGSAIALRIITASGALLCDVGADRFWTTVDVKEVIQDEISIPVNQSRLFVKAKAGTSEELKGGRLDAYLPHAPNADITLFRRPQEQAIWLEKVTHHGLQLRLAPPTMKADREVVLMAVSRNYKALEHAVEPLRKDVEVCLTALAQDKHAVDFVEQCMWSNREFVLAAVKRHWDNIMKVDDDLQDKEIALVTLEHNALGFQFLSDELRADREICIAGVRHSLKILDFVEPQDVTRLHHDAEFMRLAVLQDCRTVELAQGEAADDHQVSINAVKQDWRAWKLCPDDHKHDPAVVLAALQQDMCSLSIAFEEMPVDHETVLALVSKNWGVFPHLPKQHQQDVEICLSAAKADWKSVSYMPEEVRTNPEIGMAVVSQSGEAFKVLGENLKNDPAVVTLAVQKDGMLLELATEEIQSNGQVVKEAVIENWKAIQFAQENVRTDQDIVFMALEQDIKAIEYASDELLRNIPAMLSYVAYDGRVMDYVGPELLENPEFVAPLVNDKKTKREVHISMVKRNWKTLDLFTFDLQKQKDIVMAATEQDWHALLFLHDKPRELKEGQADSDSEDEASKTARRMPDWWADRDIVKLAVSQDWTCLHEEAKPIMWSDMEIVKLAVAQTLDVLLKLPKSYKKLVWADREIVLEAVKHDYKNMEQITAKALWLDEEIVISAIEQDVTIVQKCPKDSIKGMWANREILYTAVCKSWKYMDRAGDDLWGDKPLVLAAVKQNAKILERCPKDAQRAIWANKAIVASAVEQDWKLLKNAERDLQEDDDILMPAVRKNWKVLDSLAKAVKDKCYQKVNVVCEVLRQEPSKFKDLSEEMLADEDVVTTAVSVDGSLLEHANDALKKRNAIVTAAVQQDGMALKFAADGPKNDREVVEAAVRQCGGGALNFASKELQGDGDLAMLAEEVDAKKAEEAKAEAKAKPK